MNDIRERQVEHEKFGELFRRMYVLIERTTEEYFYDVEMPMVVLSFERDRMDKLGWYMPEDGMGIEHRMNLNVYALRDGTHAAEVIAHEMLHVWEYAVGRHVGGDHSDEFNERMFSLFGIRTEGPTGKHMAHDERWDEWLAQNSDLGLEKILLPGHNRKPGRQMLRHHCPTCDVSFHARRRMNVICGDCRAKFLVDEKETK